MCIRFFKLNFSFSDFLPLKYIFLSVYFKIIFFQFACGILCFWPTAIWSHVSVGAIPASWYLGLGFLILLADYPHHPLLWFSIWERECLAFGSWGHPTPGRYHPFGIEFWIGKESCLFPSNTFRLLGSQITLTWMSHLHSLEIFIIFMEALGRGF